MKTKLSHEVDEKAQIKDMAAELAADLHGKERLSERLRADLDTARRVVDALKAERPRLANVPSPRPRVLSVARLGHRARSWHYLILRFYPF